jgi:hypothetical protein
MIQPRVSLVSGAIPVGALDPLSFPMHAKMVVFCFKLLFINELRFLVGRGV